MKLFGMKTIRILSIAFVITFLSQLSLSAAGLEEVCKKIDQIICEQLPAGTDVAVMVYDLTDDTTYMPIGRISCVVRHRSKRL